MAVDPAADSFPLAPNGGWASVLFSLALVLLAVAGAACAITWPIAAFALALMVAISVSAAHEPVLGFLGALLLTGGEGLLKARLTIEGLPSADTLAAGAVDLLLLGTTVNLLVADRGRSLRTVWRGARRVDRVVWTLVVAWLALSIVQIPQSGHLIQGIKGFRLTQAYVPLVLAGVVLFPSWSRRQDLTKPILWVFALIAGYAALRAAIGPASWELSYAISRTPLAQLGSVTRDIGSFSSPQELAGFLAPVGAFALIVGVLNSSLRLLALVTFALAAVAVVDSYVRIGLVALALGVAVLAAVTIFGRGTPHRTKAAAFASLLVVVAGGYALALVAGSASRVAGTRARGLTHPLSDPSIQTRLHTWNKSLRVTFHHPLGTGLGTVGHATEVQHVTTDFVDNTYLKVLQEQGIFGLLFIVGVLGSTILLGFRLARAGPGRDTLAVAALGAFVAFLTVCFLGEYIELPGKVIAWTMLGVGIWYGYGFSDQRAA
jgi:O-antigen ligase